MRAFFSQLLKSLFSKPLFCLEELVYAVSPTSQRTADNPTEHPFMSRIITFRKSTRRQLVFPKAGKNPFHSASRNPSGRDTHCPDEEFLSFFAKKVRLLDIRETESSNRRHKECASFTLCAILTWSFLQKATSRSFREAASLLRKCKQSRFFCKKQRKPFPEDTKRESRRT